MQIYIGMPSIYYRIHRRLDETRRFIGNYLYYRKRKHSRRTAWSMARNTL